MTDKQLKQAISQLPDGEKFSLAYRAYEGDIRIISVDKRGTERRYRVTFEADDKVSIKQF